MGQKMYDWIVARLNEGRTVYLSTAMVVTPIRKKHLNLIKVGTDGGLYVCRGRRWIDYTYAKLTAK